MKTYRSVTKNLALSSLFLAWSLMDSGAADDTALKDAFQGHFLVGAALNSAQFSGQNFGEIAVIEKQFNTITPENVLKWEAVHPQPGHFDFDAGDKYVDFGVKHNMFTIGHNLVWHSQTPAWVFKDDKGEPLTRDALLARMRDHISTVVGRYKGRIKGWDVVNEALNEDGTMRKSSWRKIIGDDYVLKAFEFAHEADPDAELYYNDYSIENGPKRAGAIALIKSLQAGGAHISGIGVQGHYDMSFASTNLLDEALRDFSQLGIKIMITELDVDVLPRAGRAQSADVSDRARMRAGMNPYTNGLPADMQEKLAARYADLFKIFLQHKAISRVTFWGVTDANSWRNDYPVPGRTDYPLLFDRQCQPKPAFAAVIKTASP
ncbi:MAG TPA: endo-1,4-beta-xylanase [Verrucomicrobiae bacterium]|jgi:endo-1,4-beta-xylanase|nr:endo-1,4-beta-xylanase [Verrucomicrobiae bacterium]